MSDEPKVVITTSAVFCGPTNTVDGASLMRRATGSVLIEGVDFEEDEDRRGYTEGDPSAWTDGPVFLFDHAAEVAFGISHHWRDSRDSHYLVVAPDMSLDPENVLAEWPRLLLRMQRIVAATDPDFAFGWARRKDGPDPIDERYVCAKTNAVVTPWTFIAHRALANDARARVRSASSTWVANIHNGVVLRPVLTPGDRVDEGVRAALKDLGGWEYADVLQESA